MLEIDEIYRRCYNHYGMEKDEVEELVLKGKDYSGSDAEKLNAFYEDLLRANKAGTEAVEEDTENPPEDTYALTDRNKTDLERIKQAEKAKDKAAFEKAGKHLPPESKVSYEELERQLRELSSEDDS